MSSNTKLIKAYAKSLFLNPTPLKKIESIYHIPQLGYKKLKAPAPTIYKIGGDLLLVRSILLNSIKVRDIFSNPTIAENQKADILLGLLPDISITIKSFLKILGEKGSLSLIPQICTEYNETLLKYKKVQSVKLWLASSFEEDFGSILLDTLKKITGYKKIVLHIIYSPKLLGGVILQYGSIIIDASVFNKLSKFFSLI